VGVGFKQSNLDNLNDVKRDQSPGIGQIPADLRQGVKMSLLDP